MKKIDFEHHFYIPELFDYLATRTTPPKYDKTTKNFTKRLGISSPFGNIGRLGYSMYDSTTNFSYTRIERMNEAGVDIAILSSSGQIEELSKKYSIKYSKMSNDKIYEYIQKFPDRLMGSATLPTKYIQEAMSELERCKKMGFKYWHTHSNYGKEHLYDLKYIPL